MSFIQENIFPIVGILLVLIIIEGLIIYVQCKKKPKGRGKNKGVSSSSVYKEKYEKTREERDDYRSRVEQLKKECKTKEREYGDLKVRFLRNKDDYGKVIVENQKLKQAVEDLKNEQLILEKRIRELSRDNDELTKLVGKEPAPNVTEISPAIIPNSVIPKSESKDVSKDNASTNSSESHVQDVVSTEVEQEVEPTKEEQKVEQTKEEQKVVPTKEEQKVEQTKEIATVNQAKEEPKVEPTKERTMYASFPRSAGSSSYFSDLTDNLADDSYFELKLSIASGKATFKPLDFMKIRNYDPAMVAMFTEGVKPNVASTVLGVEPGKAHIEGKDWIIDNPAKIKLA